MHEDQLNAVINTLEQSSHVAPPVQDVFGIFDRICLTDVRVVIVGQNPYDAHEGQASGVAFATRDNSMSATLKVISEELELSFGRSLRNPSLSHWLAQGVMPINRVFSTQLASMRRGRLEHKLLWRTFVDALLQYIVDHTEDVVFMLLGTDAQELRRILPRDRVHIIEAPFPLKMRGSLEKSFIGSGVFIKCNEHLIATGRPSIDWSG